MRSSAHLFAHFVFGTISIDLWLIPDIVGQFVQTEGSITRATSYEKHRKMISDMLKVIGVINNYIKSNVDSISPAYIE